MNEELMTLLEQLQAINQCADINEKVMRFEQISSSFEQLLAMDKADFQSAVVQQIIAEYQQFIEQLQKKKGQVSKEIARLNQPHQAVKNYIPLETLSGIELTY